MNIFKTFWNWLFHRPSYSEIQKRAEQRARKKCSRYWILQPWKKYTVEYVEGDGLEGGVPYKFDDRWSQPYGGLYYIGESHIVIVTINGKISTRVFVHEICHFILDQIKMGRSITWHHTNLAWCVFGWIPEPCARNREGKIKTIIRKAVRCPKIETGHAKNVTADLITAKNRKK